MDILVETNEEGGNNTSLGHSPGDQSAANQGVSNLIPAGREMENKGRKHFKVARKDGKGLQGQLGRLPLSDMDMNIETTTVAAKRRLPEEEEEANHMQIDGGLAKRVK